MGVTIVLDVDADVIGFAESRRGDIPLKEKLVELMYVGAQKQGMPARPKKKKG